MFDNSSAGTIFYDTDRATFRSPNSWQALLCHYKYYVKNACHEFGGMLALLADNGGAQLISLAWLGLVSPGTVLYHLVKINNLNTFFMTLILRPR